MASTLFHATISVGVLLIFFFIVNAYLHKPVIFLPIVVFPLIILTTGLSWFLASLGVFLRDVGQTVGIIATVMLFLSSIFYLITAIPEAYTALFNLNSHSFVIKQAREVVEWGHLSNWPGLGIYRIRLLMSFWGRTLGHY